jgi:hypothetical protein
LGNELNFGNDHVARTTMNRNKFEFLKRHVCLYTDDDIKNSATKNMTIAQGVIDFMNNRFKEIYYPGKNLSLDEGICPWKGKLKFKTYNPNKPN